MRLHTSVRPVTALALVALCMAAGAPSSQPDVTPAVAEHVPEVTSSQVDAVFPSLPISRRTHGTVVAAQSPLPFGAGVPANVLLAYRAAEALLARTAPGCHLAWYHLAGIGQIESGHARGGQATPNGDTAPRILGLALDGRPGIAAIPDTDGGRLDSDPVWDRAVGPMQFIPDTWSKYGVDADGDGEADPHNLVDAAAGAGRYLCSGGLNLADPDDHKAAIFRYNHSASYVAAVLAWTNTYSSGVTPLPPRPTGDPTEVPILLAAATRPDVGDRDRSNSERPDHERVKPAKTRPVQSPVPPPRPTPKPVPKPVPTPEAPETPVEEAPPTETPAEETPPNEDTVDSSCGSVSNTIGTLGDENVITETCGWIGSTQD